jgi:hypothetical protein
MSAVSTLPLLTLPLLGLGEEELARAVGDFAQRLEDLVTDREGADS